MTRNGRWWQFSVRTRIVALAVVPLVAIGLVAGGYTIHARLADAREALDEGGRIIAANLAMAAEFALLTRNAEQLGTLCDGALHQRDVVWAAVHSSDGRVLAERGDAPPGRAGVTHYRAPVGIAGVSVTDFDLNQLGAPPEPLGWAEVGLSLDATLARQRSIQVTGLAIVGGGLLLSLLVALRIGTGISRPLTALSEAMTRYRKGDPAARFHGKAPREIAALARDFNRMASDLARSQALLRDQISSATEELEHTVEALSSRNAELTAAREEALRAGREKQEFLARMSHEIRTPLNAVIGFSRLLREDTGGESIHEYTQTIDRAATQLLTVVNDILNFTRLDSGTLELEHLPFDLRACLEDVVAMQSPAAHAKGLELALVMHRDIPETLMGDPNRIAQVLMNLVSNAIKFTAVGHVFVEAGYAPGEDGEGRVQVMVADTGIGLSPADRERLFQPFAQADSSVTRRFGGTGLGLVIVKRLVELMGGSIDLDSAPGRGSRFCFTIPCGAAPEPVPAEDDGPLAGRRVLVYDAHPVQLRALRTALLGWSMEVFNTSRANRIPLILRGSAPVEPFAVVVLGLDAEERRPAAFAQRLAEVRAHHQGPVLVLVGAELWEMPSAAQDQGPIEWTSKPVRRALLHRCLCRLLGEAPVDMPPRPLAPHPVLAGRRVLVVEDNAFNRLLLQRLLVRRGMEVRTAAGGGEAIAETRETAFDLILMDIHMPGMDGAEVSRRIRQLPGERPCPPIIALSADVFARDTRAGLFDGFLLKPVSETALDRAMLHALAAAGTDGAGGGGGPLAPDGRATGTPPSEPERLEGDLAERLTAEATTLCRRMGEALDVGDRRALRALAHELKGLAGYFGMRDLEAGVRELEGAALVAPIRELRRQLAALQDMTGDASPQP